MKGQITVLTVLCAHIKILWGLEGEKKLQKVRVAVFWVLSEFDHDLSLTYSIFELLVLHKHLLFHSFHGHHNSRISMYNFEDLTEGPFPKLLNNIEIFEVRVICLL